MEHLVDPPPYASPIHSTLLYRWHTRWSIPLIFNFGDDEQDEQPADALTNLWAEMDLAMEEAAQMDLAMEELDQMLAEPGEQIWFPCPGLSTQRMVGLARQHRRVFPRQARQPHRLTRILPRR